MPDHLLARVQTNGQVLAWSAQPLGAFAGAAVIHATGRVATVYAGIGLLMAVVSGCFLLGPLGRVQ
ncbi:hypothetical protein NKH77_01035 [Streptomyces sp. M19]